MAQKTVLIVDPDADSRFIYRSILAAHGFRTIDAVDGQQALLLAASHLPDAAIVELRVPALDGYQLIHLLRSGARTSAIRIVVVTAQMVLQSDGDGNAWDAFLVKPASPTELLDVVRNLVERDSEPSELEPLH